jgi:hypothetical protein
MGYIPGDPWAICDICGFKVRMSTTKKTWDGLRVCAKTCWSPRHPQDFVRAIPDRQMVVDARPEPEDYFLSTNEVKAEDL